MVSNAEYIYDKWLQWLSTYKYITVMVKIESTVRIEFEVEMVLEALRLWFEFCTLCPNTLKQFQVQQ